APRADRPRARVYRCQRGRPTSFLGARGAHAAGGAAVACPARRSVLGGMGTPAAGTDLEVASRSPRCCAGHASVPVSVRTRPGRARGALAGARAVSVATLMSGRRICICTGSGGVGKTTTAAAVAMGLAARGQRVAVVTIDPARRLASSLGLEQLGNEPRLV